MITTYALCAIGFAILCCILTMVTLSLSTKFMYTKYQRIHKFFEFTGTIMTGVTLLATVFALVTCLVGFMYE